MKEKEQTAPDNGATTTATDAEIIAELNGKVADLETKVAGLTSDLNVYKRWHNEACEERDKYKAVAKALAQLI